MIRRLLVLCACLGLLACRADQSSDTVDNIILMIGDGMGPQQVAQAILYRQTMQPDGPPLQLEELFRNSTSSIVTTQSSNSLVTDSAAAATAMACGVKTRNAMLGVDAEGKPCRSILRLAKSMGKATGLVSNTRLSHATPAAFAAASLARQKEEDIAAQIIDEGLVDVLLDGGARYLLPRKRNDGTPMHFSDLPGCADIDPMLDGSGKRHDRRNLVAEAQSAGYAFACTREQLMDKARNGAGKLLGLFATGSFPHIQERRRIASLPTLPDMAQAALNRLSHNPKGFFLMIEAGLIDYAGHEQDSATQLHETLEFDATIKVVEKFLRAHPNTLLLVTADHETGGYTISYHRSWKRPQSIPLGQYGRYTAHHSLPNSNVFTLYDQQQASFTGILGPILHQLYANDETMEPNADYPLAKAAAELRRKVERLIPYRLSQTEAEFILRRTEPTPHDHETYSPIPYCTNGWDSYHANKMSRIISYANYSVWATGNHSHTPVHLFVRGPESITNQVSGLIDNTDIFTIMRTALEQSAHAKR